MNAINSTKAWIDSVVVGLNFCPFAKREVVKDSIRYVTTAKHKKKAVLAVLESELSRLMQHHEVETTLLILDGGFTDFYAYLALLDKAQDFIDESGMQGHFQLASFHPEYCFEGTDLDDPANYTNRSPYPMLHILRESSLEQAIARHGDPASIPEDNIKKAASLGRDALHQILRNCLSN